MRIKLPSSAKTPTEALTPSKDPTPPMTGSPAGLGLLTLRRLSMDVLEPAPYNPRTITEKAKQGLHNSIKTFGLVEPIIWNERTGYIVGGHQRFNELRDAGVTETDVVVVSLDPTMETALNLTLNNPSIQGDWLDQQRDEMVRSLEHADAKLVADLQLESLKLPEWAPLDEVKDENLTNNAHDKVIKITIPQEHSHIYDEVRDNILSLIQNHYDAGMIKFDAK